MDKKILLTGILCMCLLINFTGAYAFDATYTSSSTGSASDSLVVNRHDSLAVNKYSTLASGTIGVCVFDDNYNHITDATIIAQALYSNGENQGNPINIPYSSQKGMNYKENIPVYGDVTKYKITTSKEGYNSDIFTYNLHNDESVTFWVNLNPNNQIYTLTINVKGSGTVSPPPGTYKYEEGTVVTLTATPETGWWFERWNGVTGIINFKTISFEINGNKVVTAVFSDEQLDIDLEIEITSSERGYYTVTYRNLGSDYTRERVCVKIDEYKIKQGEWDWTGGQKHIHNMLADDKRSNTYELDGYRGENLYKIEASICMENEIRDKNEYNNFDSLEVLGPKLKI